LNSGRSFGNTKQRHNIIKTMQHNPLIIALDTQDKKEALKLVKDLKEHVSFFKVGLELFTACGPDIIKEIKQEGCKVFVDLKFLDIPNTVRRAVSNLVKLKVDMLNVHLTGGMEMLYRARETLLKEGGTNPPKLLGVTVLTSINEDALQNDLGIKAQLDEYVLHRAKLAHEAKLDGIICSPNEVKIIREKIGKDFLIVTPGVRPQWAEKNDQKRTATPKEAIQNGASYIVIGRPVTRAEEPREAIKKIIEEIKNL